MELFQWRLGSVAKDRQHDGAVSLMHLTPFQSSTQSRASFDSQTAAAIKIQAAFRGTATRRAVGRAQLRFTFLQVMLLLLPTHLSLSYSCAQVACVAKLLCFVCLKSEFAGKKPICELRARDC